MELAYLGLFSKVFNWVMDRILDPVFKFISDLLSTVLSWVFNEILAPILFPILEDVLKFAIDLYTTIYSVHLYSLFSGVLKLIDYLEIAFDVFIGRTEVTYITDAGTEIKGSLVEVLVQHEMVSTVFWALTIGGFGIAMLLTIFGVAKSAFDLDFENKRPVSRVLTAMMKCFIQFFMVPLFVYFMLILAVDILEITTMAISGDTPTTLGRIIWMIASLNAARNSEFNANSFEGKFTLGTSEADTLRYPFYSTVGFTYEGTNYKPVDYTNVKKVNELFNLADFDYLIGFLAGIFLLFIMAVCIITFVQRIFEIVLLYIASPYFVSTMPLDDGERFGRWRDLFIGKCFTGFGSAIGMRLYLVVCQMIMSGKIRFSEAKLVSSIEIDYFMKLFFLLGGAWAVFKSGPMVTSLLSSAAGQQETMTQAGVGGALYGYTIGKAMSAGSGLMKTGINKGIGALAAKAKNSKHADPKQKFEGSKNDAKWKKGVVSPNAKRSKVTIGKGKAAGTAAKPAVKSTDKLSMAKRRATISGTSAKKPLAEALKARRATISGGERLKPLNLKPAKVTPPVKKGVGSANQLSMTKRRATFSASSAKASAAALKARRATISGGDKIKPLDLKPAKVTPTLRNRRPAMSNDPAQLAAAKTAKAAVAARSSEAAYKEKKNFRFGRMFQSTYDANGNHKIRVMGFGVERDASGNTMAFQMRLGGVRVQRSDPEQSMQLARMHLPGITKIRSNVENGQLKYSDISVLHGAVRYRNGEAGSKVRVLGGLTNVEHGSKGTDVRVLGGLTRVHHGDDGTHVRVMGGLTDVKHNEQDGTKVSVMGGVTRVHHSQQDGTDVSVLGGLTRVHHGDDGTNVRVMGGLTQVDHTASGTHVGVAGDHVLSVRTNGEKLQALKVGVLEYSRSGVVKKVPPTAVFGSAPTVSAQAGSAPTGSAPGGSTPSSSVPTSSTPVRRATVSGTPSSSAPTSSAPLSSAPTSSTPSSSTPTVSTPIRRATISGTPSSSAPTRKVTVGRTKVERKTVKKPESGTKPGGN